MGGLAKTLVTYADYLAAEAISEVKHEYLRGEIFAMAGGTVEHSRLAANVIHELHQALQGRPCVVLTSDARIRIVETDRSTYPDVAVVGGRVETAPDDPDAVTNPLLLVEVLSDSTEAADRGEKFAHYRRLPSLQEYLLVAQRSPRLEIYRRTEQGWILTEAGAGESLRLESIDARLTVDEIYRNPLVA